MIVKKEFAGKERLIAEFGNGNIIFTSCEDGTIMGFRNSDIPHDLDASDSDKSLPLTGKTWEELDPEIVFTFSHPNSIRNLILSLQENLDEMMKVKEITK